MCVKRVLCPISRLCFQKQYIGNHTFLVSYWVIRFSKTNVVAYWLWRRASDPWVIGSSPGGCKEFFWKILDRKGAEAQPRGRLDINFHGSTPATNLHPLVTHPDTTRSTNGFDHGYRGQITKSTSKLMKWRLSQLGYGAQVKIVSQISTLMEGISAGDLFL